MLLDLLLPAVDLWTGDLPFSVCRSCNCNKPSCRLECYQKIIYIYKYLRHRTTLLLSTPFNYVGAKWTQEFTTLREFRALSPYQVCHFMSFWRVRWPYVLLQFHLWLMTICAFRWSSCEVMSCNYYYFLLILLVHLYFWYVTHWVYLFSCQRTVEVAVRQQTVYST